MNQNQHATTFHDLHRDAVLVLPNAWDAGSARIMQEAGARAVATTSAGLAWSNGYPDGNALPEDVLLHAIAAIARVITVPLTADVEGGYSDDPEQVGALVERVIQAGAVGINIEDGTGSVDLLCAKIANIRKRAARLGVNLFINARTDVYLHKLVSAEQCVAETLRRGAAYKEAGANGLFVPVISQAEDIRAVCAQPLPVNVMALPSVPPAAELQALGVKRLSAGAAISLAAYGEAQRLAGTFLASGTSADLFPPHAASGRALNAMFKA